MGHDDNGNTKFATSEWVKFILALSGHAVVVFGALLYWANRIVAVETEVENVKTTVSQGLQEVRSDIKEILKRTKE